MTLIHDFKQAKDPVFTDCYQSCPEKSSLRDWTHKSKELHFSASSAFMKGERGWMLQPLLRFNMWRFSVSEHVFHVDVCEIKFIHLYRNISECFSRNMFGKKQLKTKLYLIYFSFDKNPDYDDFLNLLEWVHDTCLC